MATSIAQMFVSVGADVTQAISGLSQVETAMKRAGSNISSVGGDLTKAVTVPIVGTAGLITKFGVEFESAFTKVRKTVDLGEKDMKRLEEGLRALATTEAGGGKSAAELARVASVAGALGIEGSEALLKFTQTVAQLSGATGIAEEQIATDLAGIASVLGTPEEKFENLGSVLVELGNKMGGTEAEILELTTRLAGALGSIGVGEPQILGIASAMTALRINAEAGGTAISKFFTEMVSASAGTSEVTAEQSKRMREQQDRITDLSASLETARARQAAFGRNTPASQVQQTTEQIAKYERELNQARADMKGLESSSTGAGGKLQAFASVAGTTIDQFKNLVNTDPSQAFVKIIQGLARIRKEEGSAAQISALKDIGIDDARMADAIRRLSGGSDQLTKALGLAEAEWETNTALAEENAKAMESTENRWKILTNIIQEEFLKVWDTVRTDVIAMMEVFRTQVVPAIQDVVKWFQNLSPEVRQQIIAFAGLAAAVGPALFIFGALVTAIGAILSPIGLIAIAVAALAAAWITNFGGIRDKVMPILERLEFAFNFLKELAEPLGPVIAGAFQAILPILSKLGDLLGPAFGKGAELIGQHLKNVFLGLGRLVSFNVTVWGLIASIVGRAVREIGALLEGLQPFFQAVAGWVHQWILTPLVELLKFIGSLVEQTGVGGVEVGGIVRQGELAIQNLSGQIAAGGPGGAAVNNVEVTINNPQVPDQTASESFAAQVQNAVLQALIDAEAESAPPPPPGLAGMPLFFGPLAT